MTIRKTFTALAVTAAAIGSGLATAAPATAGGIIVVGSPSFHNGCANHGTRSQSGGQTTDGSGAAQGLLAQVPIDNALNHCGGADLPTGGGLASGGRGGGGSIDVGNGLIG
ncbi:hypothetical protein ACFUTR_28995 [Streptomyces sp. NPDC057367]|uniref:hypothetical protein n=1 Tax=Streptomyces sp. NPDC057367 TaxID=3346108 RepID=UPI003627E805